MRRISFFIGGMYRGGAERVISILANYYAKSGWDVDVVMLLYDQVQYELDPRIRVICLSPGSQKRVSGGIYWISKVRGYIRENKPSVIVSFVARINIIVLLSAFGLKQKVLISERNDPANDGRSKAIELLTRALYPAAKRIVFQTQKARSHFGKTIQEKSIVIPNPITIYAEADKPKQKIVAVGRLAEQKNHKMLIRAFSKVLLKHPDFELWIYGDGPLKVQLEELSKELQIGEKVFLPGNVSDIHRQISDAECFVLSSNYEGLSNALLEAMIMGIPCISTACAGSDEYINNGNNGLLIPVNDTEALTNAMLAIIENGELRDRISQNGKKIASKVSTERVINTWEETIKDCMR